MFKIELKIGGVGVNTYQKVENLLYNYQDFKKSCWRKTNVKGLKKLEIKLIPDDVLLNILNT